MWFGSPDRRHGGESAESTTGGRIGKTLSNRRPWPYADRIMTSPRHLLALLFVALPWLPTGQGLLAAPRGTTEPAPWTACPSPPFLVDCGPAEGDRDGDDAGRERERSRRQGRVRRLLDRPYEPGAGYGHEAGEGFHRWYTVVSGLWGDPERDVFATGRIAPESYRFDLPAGGYIVELGFCETEARRDGERVFEVQIQGRASMDDLDPFAVAGFGQCFRLTFEAVVRGREGLTVVLRRARGSSRPPLINALWIRRSEAGSRRTPPPPGNLRGFGSYGLNALFWAPVRDIPARGVLLERATVGGGPFVPLNSRPCPGVRWIDEDVAPGATYRYRIRAAGLDGQRGPYSEVLELSPRAPQDSSLPIYSLRLEEGAWLRLVSTYLERIEERCVLTYEGREYPASVRVHGNSTRRAAKLSYRIEFLEESPFDARRILYLKAQAADYTLQQAKLSCDVFDVLGIPASRATYLNLFIDGRYQGIYLDVERVDTPLLARFGRTPAAIFRSASFQRLDAPAVGRKRGDRGRLADLATFLRRVNLVDRGEFGDFLRAATDWDLVRGYHVASVICHRSEIESEDFFYARSADSGRWLLVPWDHNNGNFGVGASRRKIEAPFMPIFGQSAQGIGRQHGYWYVLWSRIVQHDALRREYLEHIGRAATAVLLSGRADGLIDANFASLRPEFLIDPYRWPPGEDGPFLRSPTDLKRFVRRHGRRLLELVEGERRRQPGPLVINEFRLDGGGGWVEIHNRGDREIPLAGFVLAPWLPSDDVYHRFRNDDRLPGGGYLVARFAHQPGPVAEGERREREELRALNRRSGDDSEAGTQGELRPESLNPWGGTVALVGPAEPGVEDQDVEAAARARRDDETGPEYLERLEIARNRRVVHDAFFFGRPDPEHAYGRVEGGFAVLEPTPGRQNSRRALARPPLLSDGGVERKGDGTVTVSATLLPLEGSAPIERLVIRTSTGVEWSENEMVIDPVGPAATRASARLRVHPEAREIRYYFTAHGEGGTERRAPLTAPAQVYVHRLQR